MNTSRILFLIAACTAFCSCAGTEKQRSCTVTYVANDGFLVTTARHKVLVDALFGGIKGDWCDQPSDSVSHAMISGVAPFDRVDAVLVTHAHVDHFNAAMAVDFLEHNPKARLVCPEQANALMQHEAGYPKIAAQVKVLTPGKPDDASFSIGSIKFRAMRFDHSSYYEPDPATKQPRNIHADVQNIGYLFTMDGFTFFHSGDDAPSNIAAYASYGLGKDSIDVAFLDRSFYSVAGLKLIAGRIPARNVVLMHIATGSDKFFTSLKSRPGDVPQIFAFDRPMAEIISNQR